MSSRPGDLLGRLFSGTQHLTIVAPYVKADALTKILAKVSPEASLICITRWNPHDLAVGASDTECRTIVKDWGGSFRLHPSLHAKYYRAGNKILIGSANLTSSGLGWSSQPNLEILCRPGEDFNAPEFEQVLFDQAREIGDEEFAHWESIAKIEDPGEKKGTGDFPQLETWRPFTREPKHLLLAYRCNEDEIASSDEQRAANHDIQALLFPADLTDEQIKAWATTCLLAAPFTNSVIRLLEAEKRIATRSLSLLYGLSITDARRDMETVQNWLAFLAPNILPRQT